MDRWMIMYHYEPRKDTRAHGLAATARLLQLDMFSPFGHPLLYPVLFLSLFSCSLF
jgi:hypothetical protein